MQLHPIGVTLSENPKLHNIPQEVSLYYSVSDKTYVTITASTTSQTTPHYQKKEDQQEQFLDNKDLQYKYQMIHHHDGLCQFANLTNIANYLID